MGCWICFRKHAQKYIGWFTQRRYLVVLFVGVVLVGAVFVGCLVGFVVGGDDGKMVDSDSRGVHGGHIILCFSP